MHTAPRQHFAILARSNKAARACTIGARCEADRLLQHFAPIEHARAALFDRGEDGSDRVSNSLLPELTCDVLDLIEWIRQDSLTIVTTVTVSQHSLERSASRLQIVTISSPSRPGFRRFGAC
ncbi:hypothetical protein Y032_0854g2700 [Ancylostoma ceylanicum]|nr:hypothetical protein Y032_0854g2700 [Ancylostoma ceylanicum]